MKKTYLIGTTVGLLINIANDIIGLLLQHDRSQFSANGYNLECPCSVFNTFILCNTDTRITRFYLYIIPVISAIVCWHYYDSNKYMRKLKTLLKTFYSGYITTFFTLLLSLIISFILFPAINPEISTGYFPLGFRGSFLYSLYINKPVIYMFILITMYAAYTGLYSIMSFTAFQIIDNKILVPIFVFLINISISNLLEYFDFEEFSPVFLLIPVETYLNTEYYKYIGCFLTIIGIIVILTLFNSIFERMEKIAKD